MDHPITALTIAWVLAGPAGCDVDEGPREELREAIEAMERGRSPSQVADELRDVVEIEHSAEFEAYLGQTEAWLERQREQPEEEGRAVSEEVEAQLDAIDKEVREARRELDAATTESDR